MEGKSPFLDPTKYSTLPPSELSDVSGRRVIDTRAGRFHRFIEPLKREHGAAEMVVSRLLKGIINVSDVVSTQDKEQTLYFSKEMPVENIHEAGSKESLRAENYIFRYVFNDHDHVGKHNLHREGNRIAHFDFHEAHRIYGNDFEDPEPFLPHMDIKIAQPLLEKAGLLIKRFSGEEGKEFISAVIKSTNKESREIFDSPEDKTFTNEDEALAHLQYVLLERLKNLHRLAEERLVLPNN